MSEPTNKKVVKAKSVKTDEVTLATLCVELKIEPRAARIKLRKAKIAHGDRWEWKVGSAELTKVKKLLVEAK
jgi:hypothetical protein